jgi:hypothetical protein
MKYGIFNRWKNQCRNCSCYVDNWDKETASKDLDHECSLEHDTFSMEECIDYDKNKKEK